MDLIYFIECEIVNINRNCIVIIFLFDSKSREKEREREIKWAANGSHWKCHRRDEISTTKDILKLEADITEYKVININSTRQY